MLRSSCGSCADHTTPIAPAPIRRARQYRPSIAPGPRLEISGRDSRPANAVGVPGVTPCASVGASASSSARPPILGVLHRYGMVVVTVTLFGDPPPSLLTRTQLESFG